jgi:NAD(P)-dependent dehydrogenase (short-subunit alcohol dehydrogenase family)
MLGEEGHGLTIASRRPEKLEPAAEALRAAGVDVEAIPANLADEDSVKAVVQRHRDTYGRLDVLVNNAGLGIGAAVAEIETKRLDMQLDVNLRSYVLFYRESADMLRAAGAEHRNAQVINTASVAGKSGQAWLSVYAATKFGVVGFTQAMNKELGPEGIKSCDTAMTDFVKGSVAAEEMIRPEDIAESVRMLLRLSPACVIPEIIYHRPGEGL